MIPTAREVIPQRQNRLASALIVMTGVWLVLGLRFTYWHLLSPAERDAAAEEYRHTPVDWIARRGTITDATGHILATDVSRYEISCDPTQLDEEDRLRIANQVAAVTNASASDVLDAIVNPLGSRHALLATDLPGPVASKLEGCRGIFIKASSTRAYPEGPLAAHLLGFVNKAKGDERAGYGLEWSYREILTGTKGVELIYDGRWGASTHSFKPPVDGADIALTINRVAQYEAERALARAMADYKAEGGSVIVMDPKTGAILAMANAPTFDPNNYAFYADNPDIFTNASISQAYEPGSVFKIITMAAALDKGLVKPNDTYDDNGPILVGGRSISNALNKTYGTVTMTEILVYSLNVGAAKLSTGMRGEVFYDYVQRFGFGHLTGVDLAGEARGEVHLPGSAKWSESDLGANAFGQAILVTPLQMVSAVAAVANGGKLMKPYVVQSITQNGVKQETQPVVIRQVISPETARQVAAMMAETADRSYAEAAIPGYRMAGKSGTAQIAEIGGYADADSAVVASFVGFLPVEDPQFVILVKVDRPQSEFWGAAVALPVFQQLANRLIAIYDVPPSQTLAAGQNLSGQ